MPPKVRITKEDIVKTTVELVRECGAQSINARAIATAIGCSTQPIFSNFRSMEELEEATVFAAHKIYLGYLSKESSLNKYPKYKSFGMAYVRFAREERELFKLLFMRDRCGEGFVSTTDFEESVSMIVSSSGVSEEVARLMHFEMWSCVHGIATMIVTSFLSLEEELVSTMLSDVYQGIRAKHLSEEGNNGCN